MLMRKGLWKGLECFHKTREFVTIVICSRAIQDGFDPEPWLLVGSSASAVSCSATFGEQHQGSYGVILPFNTAHYDNGSTLNTLFMDQHLLEQ